MRTVLLLLLAVVVTGAAAQPAGPAASDRPGAGSTTVLQMNLCLSGVAGCYSEADHPAVVAEASARIRATAPDVVTVNEVCRQEARQLAAHTGYRLRFAAVLVRGSPLRCVTPDGRGVYGMAVLTTAPVLTSDSHALGMLPEAEERRWLCVSTSRVTACTAHLATRTSSTDREANDAECLELRRVLSSHAVSGPTVFGGDANRRRSCDPSGMWATSDGTATQAPGLQHVYGSTSLGVPVTEVTPSSHTDHDFLTVTLAVR